VKHLGEAAAPSQPAPAAEERLRVDDVLEAHELLREYNGDVHGLFERVSGR
jgi:hypothetical protein